MRVIEKKKNGIFSLSMSTLQQSAQSVGRLRKAVLKHKHDLQDFSRLCAETMADNAEIGEGEKKKRFLIKMY